MHTLILKCVIIACTRIDTCGERPDTYKIAPCILYRSEVRLEAYAHRIKAQQVHAATQHKLHTQHTATTCTQRSAIDFISAGLFDASMKEQRREPPSKKERCLKVPARPKRTKTLKLHRNRDIKGETKELSRCSNRLIRGRWHDGSLICIYGTGMTCIESITKSTWTLHTLISQCTNSGPNQKRCI